MKRHQENVRFHRDRWIRPVIPCVLLALLAVGCGDGSGDSSVPVDERAERVAAIIEPYANDSTPALVALVSRGDRILYQHAYGLANIETGEPATTDHVFLIASVSKSLTAVAVLMLVDQGQIALDDPVSTNLPELARFGEELTIRHLLQHTSGLPEYYLEPVLSALLARSPFPTNADLLAVLSELGAPQFAPGDRFRYSDTNFLMLALIVERVSGQRFSAFQQAHIFDPVGMHSSFSAPNPEREATARLVQSYAAQKDGGFTPYELAGDPTYNLYGAGEVVSNVEDIFRFDRALFSGQLVSRDLLEQAFTPTRLNNGTEPPFLPFQPDSTYGLGFIIGNDNGHRRVGHGGAFLGFRTYYAHFPDDDLSVMFMMAQDFDRFWDSIVLPIAEVYLESAE